jgi:hypothetical protein
MKFTRIFLLKALCSREDRSNTDNPFQIFKDLIISHPNIDLALTLILSFLLLITKYTTDIDYIYSHGLNVYFITTSNFISLSYYFILDTLDKYSSKKMIKNTSIIQENSNSNTDHLISSGNTNFQLPLIVFDNWHLIKTSLHFVKILITILSYFLSLYFCVLFSGHKNVIDKEKYLLMHLLILEFYEFYSGFRVCYFLIKFLINIFLLPVYISSLILGFYEDRFNENLNKLVNTKLYTGRTSIKSPPNGRVSELEEYCSICLNSFKIDEFVSSLPCSRRHTFHTNCLEKWFLTTVTCPLCRSDFQDSIAISNELRESRPFEQNLIV